MLINRLETLITGLNDEGIEPDILLSHLLYIKQEKNKLK